MRRLALLLGALLFFAGPASLPAAAAMPTVAFYYGSDVPWDELAAFDVAVVEPDHVPAPPVLTGGRTAVFAYVSVGEVDATRAYRGSIPPAWLVGENTPWNASIIDLSQPEWPQWFVRTVISPLWERGFRGFFLDTLDSYQMVARSAEARAAQQAGLVRVVREIRRAFPDAKLFFNRGFEILPEVKGEVFAVAAESLFQGWDQASKAYRPVPDADRAWLTGELARVRDEYRLPVVAIDYAPPEDRALARATAKEIEKLGFVPWVANPALDLLGVGSIEVMPRKVLMVFQPAADSLMEEPIHRVVSAPLNHLGLVPVYVNLRTQPLPGHPLAGRYAGVVTWFGGELTEASQAFRALAERAVGEGVPLVMLGDLGLPQGDSLEGLLGLRRPGRLGPPEQVRVARRDRLVGFEAQPMPNRFEFFPLEATAGEALLRIDDETGARMDAIALTRWGGYALDPFAVVELPGELGLRWVVQPIEFLRRALRVAQFPVPDVTTGNGRRLMVVHMDGDGFANRAELPGAQWAAEVMLRDVLQRYRVPMTVSVIQGEIAPNGLYPKLSPVLEPIARKMFALPHVEIASHSFSHPFAWAAAQRAPAEPGYALEIPGYQFDLKAEIEGSLDYINTRLAPPGKRARVYLWTGDTDPLPEAVARVERAGVLNMNGGDTTMTRAAKSLTRVAPLGIPKGQYFQVYAPNQNENVYTNDWTGPFYGFERAIETYQLTESPYRLKPINIYFHTYAASKYASLQALHHAFRWALSQPVMNVYASEYIRKVLDFNGMVVARSGDGWLVRGNGDLRQLRVPAAAGYPDLGRSQDVAGFSRHNDQHYLHLASGEARVVLRPAPPDGPYLRASNGRIEAWSRGAGELAATLASHTPLVAEFGNATGCEVRAGARPVAIDRDGTARIGLNDRGRETIVLRCGD